MPHTIPFNFLIIVHRHNLTWACATTAQEHQSRHKRSLDLASPLQNLIFSTGATKFHFFVQNWSSTSHNPGSTTFVDPMIHRTARGSSLWFTSILIRQPSHLGWSSKLADLCEYSSKLMILTILHRFISFFHLNYVCFHVCVMRREEIGNVSCVCFSGFKNGEWMKERVEAFFHSSHKWRDLCWFHVRFLHFTQIMHFVTIYKIKYYIL